VTTQNGLNAATSAKQRWSSCARELDERIEEFTRDTIGAGLHELPG
jgi:hypothetical protein